MVDDLSGDISYCRPFIELPLIISQLFYLMFLAQDLAELVGVVDGKPTQDDRDVQHIFLIHHNAQRFG